jgi:chromosome segregation protein
MLAEAAAAEERAGREAAGAEAELAAAGDTLARLARDAEAAAAAQEAAAEAAEASEADLVAAEAARAETQAREAAARAALSAAEGEAGALRAEAGALARLVEREAQAGRQLLDRLTVTPGFEAALGAALAEDLRAPEVGADAGSGWVALPPLDGGPALPAGATPLAAEVEAPPVLARRLAQIGVVPAEDGAALQAALAPGQRLVSRAGDLWRWDGFRQAAEAAPTAAALRLKQRNRLSELKRELNEATARAEGAQAAHALLSARLADLTRADQAARDARRDADRALIEAGRALARAEAERDRAGSRRESVEAALSRHREEAAAAAARRREAEAAAAELPAIDGARAALEAERAEVEAARAGMLTARSAHDALRREGEARAARAAEVARELEGWRRRQASAQTRLAELADRQAEAEAELAAAWALPAELAERGARAAQAVAAAETRRTAAAEALAGAERALRTAAEEERRAERLASEAREARAAADARAAAEAEGAARAEAAIREATEASPARLAEALGSEIERLPDAEAAEAAVGRLRRQGDALGAVNLRAEEDARAVQAEHDALAAEKADLEAAIAKLRGGIGALNREGRERLLTAFEQVNANFAMLFTHLFGGGEARLALVESDDPLEAGLEILCQPPGKKLSTLSLLSGGEQTLTALALIFGVFLTNPAPICVLDEVDAPLDDANVARFCDLLDEMTRRTETRFLIITHNGVTMSRMDRLFGVTMAEQGVSQLVSVDLRRAEQLVA